MTQEGGEICQEDDFDGTTKRGRRGEERMVEERRGEDGGGHPVAVQRWTGRTRGGCRGATRRAGVCDE